MKNLLLLSLLLVGLVANAGGSDKVIHLNFLHRHGARTEPLIQGEILNWAGCVLSEQGALMALSLGRYLNHTYGPNSSNPLFPAKYNWTVIESRSTDFERTIRTGVGVLRGIYGDSDELAIPYLYHQKPDIDYEMGYFYSWPSAVLRTSYLNTFNMANNAKTLEVFDQTTLNEMGDAINTTICPTQQTLCALASEDIATCSRSNGPNPMNPVLKKYLYNDDLYKIQSESFAWQYLWSRSDRYWANTGPYGRILAKNWVANFRKALAARGKGAGQAPAPSSSSGSNGADENGGGGADDASSTPYSPMVNHYSAHDITIYGFFVAIGVVNETTTDFTTLIPTFTSAVIGEVSDDGWFTLKYAQCDQDYDSGYPFTQVPQEKVNMGCMKTSGEKYWSHTCPLDDFERFVDVYLKPDAVDPDCYADPRDVQETGCDKMGDAPANKYCFEYRRNCGRYACKSGYTLNRVTMACVKLAPTEPNRVLTVGPALAIAASSFLLGAVMGLVFRMFRAKRKAQKLLLEHEDEA